MRIGKTTGDRLQYGNAEHFNKPHPFHNYMPDDGTRIPLRTIPGLLEALRQIKANRLERGPRAHLTKEEAVFVRALANAAAASGWTYREVGRALGMTAPAVMKHLDPSGEQQ